MKTVPVGHTKFVDLYNYKGTADPILVAMAVVLREDLLLDEWVIVSQDKEVRAKAKAFEIGTLRPKELAVLTDAAAA